MSVSTCFYTNVNALVYTCVCERACVHKVPPCKCLIVCVGNNSPIPQGMKQAWKRPGPQTSRDPQGTGPPGEPPQGQPRPPPRKGQRRARRRDIFSNINALLRVMVTLPMTTCTVERLFSAAHRIKTRLRSSMSTRRHNSLSLLSMEHELADSLDNEEIIALFNSKPRRLRLVL